MKCVVFLCQNHELTRERRGYYRAFSKRLPVVCTPLVVKDGLERLGDLVPKEFDPILILQPEASARLPQDLIDSQAPTGCFQIDTHSGTEKRIQWSMLYDYVFVFHSGFDRIFQDAGHARTIHLSHAVERELFEEPDLERIYEVGWVGTLRGAVYSTRRRYIGGLITRFRMNPMDRYYSPEEMATAYRQSRIAVNVSGDEFLSAANLRCFEIMASGALLLTPSPTELSAIGFVPHIHYVPFSTESELHELIRYYLHHEDERRLIADAARSMVLREHTYDARVRTILDALAEGKGELFAPARQWDKAEVQATYLHYYAKHLMLDSALREIQEIAAVSKRRALCGLPMVTKAFVRALQLSL